MRTVAAPTMERQRSTGYRRVANSRTRQGYRGMTAASATASVSEYARPYPNRLPELKPLPRTAPRTASAPVAPERGKDKAYAQAKRKQIWRTFFQIATVFVMCSLMIYRYAVILESNDRIAKLNQQIAEMEYDNQFLAAKLDSALELGAVETYATEELGMMHPDSSQVFYIDVDMGDAAVVEEEEENRSLQGAPGALMHAIRVLK